MAHFDVSGEDEAVCDAIISHMYPFGPAPTTREGWILSVADKAASLADITDYVRGFINGRSRVRKQNLQKSDPFHRPKAKVRRMVAESGHSRIPVCDGGLDHIVGVLYARDLIRHLGSALTDVSYIFDEPSVGLHPRDVHRLNELLQKLRDKGNTVLVVEHDPDVIRAADHVVDVGMVLQRAPPGVQDAEEAR